MVQRIIALEDTEARITWLKHAFPDIDVMWCQTVDEFTDALKNVGCDELMLVLLDHDLGLPEENDSDLLYEAGSFPLDKNGKNGMHAVETMSCPRDIPVIVWSINTVKAPIMIELLKARGFIARWLPFKSDSLWQLRSVIASQIA